MNCKTCGMEIPRGGAFKQTEYKSYSFCSEKCFLGHKTEKSVSPQRKLTDYIQAICPVEPNWAYVVKQSQSVEKKYGVSQKEQFLIIRYAIEYEGVQYNSDYGLGQFFPKYIQPCREFVARLKESAEIAASASQDNTVKVKTVQRERHKREDLEF